ncbi:MAG: Trm112 family protein [Pseudomonadota bacterium]
MSDAPYDGKMLEVLICPLTHDTLVLDGARLISKRAKLAYPIKEGIPILLADEAEPFDD